ncbi:MAG: PhoH family protein, partial [Bacillota bacterium]|nr:PhoH family protein [Bacillota bacterium]
KIIAMAKGLADKSDIPTVLVSKDMYMQIKGDAVGLQVQDYKTDRVELEKLYSGYEEAQLTSEQILKIDAGGIPIPDEWRHLQPNQFLIVHSSKNADHHTVARRKGDMLIPLQYNKQTSWGLKPINPEQEMAYELLMDPEVNFVSVSGGAGSGKTIVATAVALQKVIEEGAYRKIVFVRPVVAAGDNIGYLPGDENEKLRPWMGSFYDAIENLIDAKAGKRQVSEKHTVYHTKPDFAVDEFIEQQRRYGVIETKTFTYMRGRTFSDALVIVDEAQEITPHLAKLMLTRAGYGSKFVFLGDPSDNQIDNTLVDSKSNGLVYVIEKLKHSELTGHVSLRKVVRSPLAEVAERDL